MCIFDSSLLLDSLSIYAMLSKQLLFVSFELLSDILLHPVISR